MSAESEVSTGSDREVDLAQAERRAEEALARFLSTEQRGISRTHWVQAIVLAHDGARWLPRTLNALSTQNRPPDLVVGVDAASADASVDLLRAHLPTVVTTSAAGVAAGLAAGVAAGAAIEREPVRPRDVAWYWILHDDSAPAPDCLAQLLAGADRNPEAHVVVPKAVAWSDPGRLVGIGYRWLSGVPAVDRLDPGERDQGQRDGDQRIYLGNSAGMLVRADTWAALSGIDPRYGQWAGALDLCRRVWGSGGQVWCIPAASVAHRRAGELGLRDTPGGESREPGPPQAGPRPRRQIRRGQVQLELSQSPAAALPWRVLRSLLTTLVRALALLLTREPEDASDELSGTWSVLAHPGRLRAARRALRRPPVTESTRPALVRARRGVAIGLWWESWMDSWRRSRPGRRSLRLSRRTWVPLVVTLALVLLSFVRSPDVLVGVGTLRGGGLLPAPRAGALLSTYLDSWQDVRFGVPTWQPSYLPLLAAASLPLLGSVDLLLRLMFGLAVPLAFLSAYTALGSAWRRRQRLVLAVAWAVLPAGAAAMSDGRISTLVLLLIGPLAARLVVDALAPAGRRTGVRAAIAAGTVLGITVSFAPLVYLVVLLAAPIAWLVTGASRRTVRTGVVILGVAAIFVVAWIPRLVAAPWLLLSDLGRNAPSLSQPAPSPWGLSPGGPGAVLWVGVPLLVLSVAVVVLAGRTARLIGGLAAGLALVAVAAWTPALASWLWPALEVDSLWPGQLLLLASGLVLLVLAASLREDGLGRSVLRMLWAGCVLVLAVGWWIAPTSMTVWQGTGLPPVVGLAEGSLEQPRALVLDRGDQVRYAVSTTPTSALGQADALAAPEQDPRFAADVAALVSGASGDAESDLGGRGIRYVVLNSSPGDPLVDRLDAVIGLRRLASSETQTLWLVAGEPVRAALIGPTDTTESVTVPVATIPTSIDVVLHPQIELPRQLVLAESYDQGWRAMLDGEALALRADARGVIVAQIGSAGALTVEHRSIWPYLALAQLVAMGVAIVLALPKRRPSDLDPGQDGSDQDDLIPVPETEVGR